MGGWNKSHGMTKSPEFKAWVAMRQRCNNPKHAEYARYGARGIKVCPEWNTSFEAFIRDMGVRPSARHSIERKDNDRGYEPENCIWATADVQMRNRRICVRLTLNGVTKTAAEWARDLGCRPGTIVRRKRRGLSDEQALTEPFAIKGGRAVMLRKTENRPYTDPRAIRREEQRQIRGE